MAVTIKAISTNPEKIGDVTILTQSKKFSSGGSALQYRMTMPYASGQMITASGAFDTRLDIRVDDRSYYSA